jgi:protein involved in polysaccharide export with SLBB domain
MTTSASRGAALLAALALAACRSREIEIAPTAARSTFASAPDWGAFPLGPNDVLRVGVYGHPELSAPPHPTTASGTRVGMDGDLSLPLAGPVHVAGLSIAQARDAITAAFAKYVQEPRVDVSVIEYAARRFYVLGEVETTGAFVFDRPLNAYQALALAGGFTSKADRSEVVLLRGSPEDLEVRVIDAGAPGAAGYVALRPDDLLFVRRTGAGRFSDEILPYLSGISSALSSAATILLIEDRLND